MEPIRDRKIYYQKGTDANGQPVVGEIDLDLFVYQVPAFDNLAAGAVQTQQIIVQADSDFEWVQAVYEFDLAAAQFTYSTRPMPNMSVVIVDTGSGRQLMSGSVPVTSLFGQPENPYVLPITRTFKANASVQFTVTNFDAATATGHLRLSLIGYKRFYMN